MRTLYEEECTNFLNICKIQTFVEEINVFGIIFPQNTENVTLLMIIKNSTHSDQSESRTRQLFGVAQ